MKAGGLGLRPLGGLQPLRFGGLLALVLVLAAGSAWGQSTQLVRDAWLEKPGDPLRKGQLAYIIVKACGIKGGLTMRLTGVSERYALRECIFLNLLVRGSTGNYVSGLELLGSVGRAEKYLEEHPRTS